MRVALVGPYPAQSPRSPSGDGVLASASPAGGVDAVVLALARGLVQRGGLTLSVITAVPGLQETKSLEGEGYRVYCVPRPRGGRLTGQRQVVRNLCAQIDAVAPDIVHAHIAGVYGRAALDSGRAAVVTLHGIIYREMQQAWATSSWPARLRWLADARLERNVVRQARDIVAISPYVLTQVRVQRGAQFHLIENPVDDRFFADVPPPPETDRLLCVARVIPRKGILALIEAFAGIRRVRQNATLDIVGEMDSHPGYVAECRERARALGVDGAVKFAGALPIDQVRAQCAACDLFVLASEQETAPVSIAEAMAMGRAVVATDVGGCSAMVADGVTGRIVPPRDPRAFADAVLALLSDRALCAAMGQAARRAAQERFALRSVADATAGLYGAIMDRNDQEREMRRTSDRGVH